MNRTIKFIYRISFIKIIIWLSSLYSSSCFQIGTICTSNQYFDSTTLDCKSCPTSLSPSEDGKIYKN